MQMSRADSGRAFSALRCVDHVLPVRVLWTATGVRSWTGTASPSPSIYWTAPIAPPVGAVPVDGRQSVRGRHPARRSSIWISGAAVSQDPAGSRRVPAHAGGPKPTRHAGGSPKARPRARLGSLRGSRPCCPIHAALDPTRSLAGTAGAQRLGQGTERPRGSSGRERPSELHSHPRTSTQSLNEQSHSMPESWYRHSLRTPRRPPPKPSLVSILLRIGGWRRPRG